VAATFTRNIMNNRAIIVGASGLIGKALQVKLVSHFDKLIAVSRKPLRDLPVNAENVVIDFDEAYQVPRAQSIFCALGTTIKTAGSQAAFRKVDFDYVIAAAKAAQLAGVQRMAVVSALGASAKSNVFYSRTKGEMEEALKAIGFAHLLIVRPSFLSGDRLALGQTSRPGEAIALTFASFLKPLVPKKYRAISADAVAACMIERLSAMTTAVEVIESDELQRWQC
jgi:uncharacterized protein YbjT (DUF2867 family)